MEGVSHEQIVVVEADLSRQHPRDQGPKVHAQTVGVELETILGEPDAIKEVAHAQIVVGELYLKLGEPGDPNANAPAHLEGAETESLVNIEDHWWRRGQPGRMRASKRTGIPMPSCESPGVSHLVTPEEAEILTLSPMPPLITPEAARAQRSPAVNTVTLATPDPEGSTDLVWSRRRQMRRRNHPTIHSGRSEPLLT